MKKLQTVSDARGEFSFHATPANYVVKAASKGFRSAEKQVTLGEEGRVDVTFNLAPESK